MQRRMKKRLAFFLTLVMLLSCAGGAWAANVETVTAQLRPDFTIIIDGSERLFYTSAGEEVYPILYNGTTYLPLRAIGEVMGKNVNWDQATKTITLYGTRSDRTDVYKRQANGWAMLFSNRDICSNVSTSPCVRGRFLSFSLYAV